MADILIHISQAKHNKETAFKLVNEPPYHDWGITAGFYSAIHYFEAWLFNKPEKHCETSIPTDSNGEFKYTAHTWREKIIQRFPRDQFNAFRKLRNASETARYLSFSRLRPGQSPNWLPTPATQYFKDTDAKRMIAEDLKLFRRELKIELIELLHNLKLELGKESLTTAPLIVDQIRNNFNDKSSLLSASENDLKRFLQPDTTKIVIMCLQRLAKNQNNMAISEDESS